MSEIINSYKFGDFSANYILNDKNRAVLVLTPVGKDCDLLSEKNIEAYDMSSLAHLKLSCHDMGVYSNSLRLSDTVNKLKFTDQKTIENKDSITVITTEMSEENYGIRHYLTWYHGEKGCEVYTEFFNDGEEELELQYLTSASLEALSPYLSDEGSKDLVFHRFKTGWSTEGLHQANTLCELGLERAWGGSGECIRLSAAGSRAVREYHPFAALEDTKNNIIWGVYLAHNTSWQIELSRWWNGVSLSAGIADVINGMWTKKVKKGETFKSPTAMIGVAVGSIAELSNRIIDMRHRAIDAYGEDGMGITYNEFAYSWGKPTEPELLKVADILKNGKTKYFVMDAGWFYRPEGGPGGWILNKESFPNGLKTYTDIIKNLGMIPGIWMEFEACRKDTETFKDEYSDMMLSVGGRQIVCPLTGGAKLFDFRKPKVIEYMDEKVIKFLKDNGFGYLKIDYNINTGIGVDGEESLGENLRQHMEAVRNFVIKIKKEIPDIMIENCASGGCRLEPSMMDITGMSSASDTHDVYEGAIVAANLHYLTPPRQNQVWCTLRPQYDHNRFTHIISIGFLGRLCWSGDIAGLSKTQLDELFAAEKFYERVAPIIKHGNSYIYRTDMCSFHSPTGTQAVVRYSEDGNEALVVIHTFEDMKNMKITLKGNYKIADSLYENTACIKGDVLEISNMSDFTGNVLLLSKK